MPDVQQEAADKSTEVAKYNLTALQNQLSQALENYDISDTQNRSQADKQKKDASRQGSTEQFGQTKTLQNALKTVLNDQNTALNSSLFGELAHATRTKQDVDYADTLNTQLQNWNTAENAYQDAANANQLSRNDAISNYIYQASQLVSNLLADRYNYGMSEENGLNESAADIESMLGISDLSNYWDEHKYSALLSSILPYITEANRYEAARKIQNANTLQSGGYMSEIANGYNNRKMT